MSAVVTPEELLRQIRKWLIMPSSDDVERTAWPEMVAQIDATLSSEFTSDNARRAAVEISSTFGLRFQEDSLQRAAAIISKHFAASANGEQWRQGMKDAAKEVCDACSNEERYGSARKVEGSTRWWHGVDADFQCEAGGIWHALDAAAAPADNDASLLNY